MSLSFLFRMALLSGEVETMNQIITFGGVQWVPDGFAIRGS